MSAADLYPRPSRETIAAQVLAQQPAAADGGDPYEVAVTPREPLQDPVKNFAVHLSARMRALGWDQAKLREHSGLSLHVLGRAMNGNGVELGVADQLAGITGGYLATMIGPYMCSTCTGEPPKGFGCLECGAETRAS